MTEDEMRKLYRQLCCAALAGPLAKGTSHSVGSSACRTAKDVLIEICINENSVIEDVDKNVKWAREHPDLEE